MSSIDSSRPILVYLANGVQGGAVVRAVLRRGLKVRAIVRNRARVQERAALGVELVEADLHDRLSLREASMGVAHAVLQIPIASEDEMRIWAGNALAASTACGLDSLILKLASASRPAPCSEPSFIANAMVEDMVRGSRLPFAIVRPTMYLDNLLKPSARMEIVERGMFMPPIPETQRIAWTSAEDCAEAALTLLERGAYGGDHRIAGPESVTGDEFAARMSVGLESRVVYRSQALDDFEREVDATVGPGAGRRVASKFRFFAANRDEADAILSGPFTPQAGLDGFRPTSIEAWVRRHRDHFMSAAVGRGRRGSD